MSPPVLPSSQWPSQMPPTKLVHMIPVSELEMGPVHDITIVLAYYRPLWDPHPICPFFLLLVCVYFGIATQKPLVCKKSQKEYVFSSSLVLLPWSCCPPQSVMYNLKQCWLQFGSERCSHQEQGKDDSHIVWESLVQLQQSDRKSGHWIQLEATYWQLHESKVSNRERTV